MTQTAEHHYQISQKTGFGLLGLAAITVLCLILLDSGIAGAGLFIVGGALGAMFFGVSFGFASGWRNFITSGDGMSLAGQFVLIGLCALLFIPAASLGFDVARTIAPISVSLLIGAFMFGIGMQLANGCGSGVLFSFGGGSQRMVFALPAFIVGSVMGAWLLPDMLRWGSVDPVIIADGWNIWAQLGLTLLLVIAAIAFFWQAGRRAGGHLSRRMLTACIVIALLCWGAFLLAGHPWGVTFGFTLWGGKIAQALGVPIAQTEFWSWAGPARALSHSVLADASSVMNIGMLIGASGWAIYTTRFGQAGWPPVGQVMAAIIGGLLMGVGARLGFGCNIGAFLGGIASGSLHGWVWFICAFAGSYIGIWLRPYFGFEQAGQRLSGKAQA